MTGASATPPRSAARRLVPAAAIAIGLLAVAVAAVLSVTGVRLFAIQTPSMGQTAPVGSVVVVQPEPAYAVGDIVTFRVNDLTVTHRIVEQSGNAIDRTFATRGDGNDVTDGWSLAPSAIIGRAVAIVPGLGFALTAAPWLLLGAVIVEAVTWLRRAHPAWSWSVRLVGWALTSAVVSLVLRPWFNIRLLDYRPADDGSGVLMHVVNTGLLPMLAGTTRLVSGEAATVPATTRLADGAFSLTPVADPSWPVRLLLTALCLIPFVVALIVRHPDPEPSSQGLRARPDRRAARVVVPVGLATVAAVVVLISVSTSTAAFSATLRGDDDAAGTNPFFSCRTAQSFPGAADTWAAYALSSARTFSARDFSGNGRHGSFAVPSATSTSIGCRNDSPKVSTNFSGSQCLHVPGAQVSPQTFSVEAWFSTTAVPSGKIIGFGDGLVTSSDPSYWDRHLYLDEDGRVVFGLFPDRFVRVESPPGISYADGQWHAAVATLSSAGARLYVDGELVASDVSVTVGQNYTGWWKIGCGNLLYWSGGADTFTGRLQYAAIYTRALSADEVRWHYRAGQ